MSHSGPVKVVKQILQALLEADAEARPEDQRPGRARGSSNERTSMTRALRSSDRRARHHGTRIHVQGPLIWKA